MARITDEIRQQVIARKQKEPAILNTEIAREFGLHRGTVSDILRGVSTVESKVSVEVDESDGDTRTISLPKTPIHTLDELIKHFEIDLTIWQVEKFQANKWEMGAKNLEGKIEVTPLFQVKAFLRRNKQAEFAKSDIEALRKEALQYSPSFKGFTPKKASKSGNVVEFSLSDHHFGSLIWGKETGGADWDNTIALRVWKEALHSLVDRVRGFNPEKALLVLGNDQQNADNRAGTTEGLTPQVMDSRYQKVYNLSKEASRWAIDKLIAEYGAVHVVMVPGNHDPLATWHLGDYLQTWYRNCSAVTVDNSVPMRKWWEHGVVMICFEHGHKGKLVDYDRIMASAQPAMWGRTKWREAHTGDKHHRKTIENKGATIRILPSLRPSCAWSTENHFTGSIRAAEAFVWSKTDGLIGQATFSVLDNHVV